MAKINPVKIVTPHAAVIIWNYEDRLGVEDTPIQAVNDVKEIIISTISLMSIATKKTKGEPTGRFELNLAPTKNWVSEITSGSWMCVMMSQSPITKADLSTANPAKIKFFGKIESVRFSTSIIDPQSGARNSGYTVTGVDWAHIFENNVYIDPFIERDNNVLGSATYIGLFEKVIGQDNRSAVVSTRDNIANLIKIIGEPFNDGIIKQSSVVNRVAKVDYSFALPTQVQAFFGFSLPSQNSNDIRITSTSANIIDAVELITGKLTDEDEYTDVGEAYGFIDPGSLKGISTLWQLIVDNSCPVLNETLADMRWNDDGSPTLALYNRIKPFTYRATTETQQRIQTALTKETFGATQAPQVDQQQEADIVLDQVKNIMSQYQLVRTIDIDLGDILDFNSGTNWRDKFNFAEIKPNWLNAEFLSNWIKTIAQTADVQAFQREGFRPLIMSTKQFPTFNTSLNNFVPQNDLGINPNVLAGWKQLLREWYFDTHRLLNGSMTIIGQEQYIQVGDNVRVPLDILGRTHNINQGALKTKDAYLLLHVEAVGHSFRHIDGARTFTTNISFVRGIVVSSNGSLVGQGKTDDQHSAMTNGQYRNTNNIVATSTAVDPDPQKLRGT